MNAITSHRSVRGFSRTWWLAGEKSSALRPKKDILLYFKYLELLPAQSAQLFDTE
jgi:hypothetical protein